jgi:hypothetical protein
MAGVRRTWNEVDLLALAISCTGEKTAGGRKLVHGFRRENQDAITLPLAAAASNFETLALARTPIGPVRELADCHVHRAGVSVA